MTEQPRTLDEWITQRGLDAITDPVYVYDTDSTLVAGNRAAETFWKVPNSALIDQFNLRAHAKDLGQELVDHFFLAVETGEAVQSPPLALNVTKDDDLPSPLNVEAWFETTYVPLKGEVGQVRFIMVVARNITEDVRRGQLIKAAELEIEVQRQTIAELESANQEIERQRAMINELSSPVIDVWGGVLLIPLVGSLEQGRAALIAERVLAAIAERQASFAVIDLTGVPNLDTGTADHLLRIARMIKLLGAECILAGIQPMVAQTITTLELSLDEMRVFQALRDALQFCMNRKSPGSLR
ncbi:MAG: STAS domain-containing protein [Nannocystaceae bacterium]